MPTNTSQLRLRELLAEKNRRKTMALRLYRPMPSQEPFHLSRASERVVRGGNRAGKTVTAAVEVASAALGIPLTSADGRSIPNRYPKRPLLIWVIGYNEKHIARMYRKLFRPGLFKIIKDKSDGRWRAWNPNDPDDVAREAETKPSPPLIPGGPECSDDGAIAEWAWDNKAERIFSMCRLKNGTEIYAFASGGEAAQGDPVDLIWIDEDIKIAAHVEEWQARLSDVRGRLIWSAWPHSHNIALKRMSNRAEEERGRASPDVEEWILSFSANPHIPSDEKRKRLAGWASAGEAVVSARDRGEYTDDLQLVFPGFNVEVHGIPRKAGRDSVEEALAENNFNIPRNWTHYLSIDPGHANAAAIFGAVPPPSVGKFLIIYNEVFAQRCDAEALAAMIAEKSAGITFHAFVIDAHAGRQTVLGGGKRVVEFYREAFERHGLKSRLTEFGFLPGSDDISARNMVVRQWQNIRADGTTLFRIVSENTPHTRHEFGLYKKAIRRDEVTDKVQDKDNHCMDATGYLCAYLAPMFDCDAAYFPPPQGDGLSPVIRAYKSLMDKFKIGKGAGSFHLGPGAVSDAA